MDKDRTEGHAKDVAGSAKETVGKVTGDRETEHRGQVQEAAGKVQKVIGKIKDAVTGKR